MPDLDSNALGWTALLGRWVDFAKASLAIPEDAEGERWRQVVPAVINLQAVTFALAELAELAVAERGLARDRAGVLIDRSAAEIGAAWRGVEMPALLVEIQRDAGLALSAARYAGTTELVWPGPTVLVVPALSEPSATGTLAVMMPGTLVMPGEPVAWWLEREPPAFVEALAGCAHEHPPVPHQVYRQLDDDGHITRDVIASILDDPLPGFPLLVPLFEHGERIGAFTMEAGEWEARQRAALVGEAIPVVRVEEGG